MLNGPVKVWVQILRVNFNFTFKLGLKVGLHILHDYTEDFTVNKNDTQKALIGLNQRVRTTHSVARRARQCWETAG